MLAVEQMVKMWPVALRNEARQQGQGHVIGTEQVHGQHLAQLRAVGGLVLQAAGHKGAGVVHQHFHGQAQRQHKGRETGAVVGPAQVGGQGVEHGPGNNGLHGGCEGSQVVGRAGASGHWIACLQKAPHYGAANTFAAAGHDN